MNLTPCGTCGQQMAKTAKACPHCGAPVTGGDMRQLITVLAGAAVIVLMGLFPPWTLTYNHEGTRIATAIGYAPLFMPPSISNLGRPLGPLLSFYGGVEVDIGRLFVQWAVVAAACGGLVVWFRADKSLGRSKDAHTTVAGGLTQVGTRPRTALSPGPDKHT